jgi:hypothetical protein
MDKRTDRQRKADTAKEYLVAAKNIAITIDEEAAGKIHEAILLIHRNCA